MPNKLIKGLETALYGTISVMGGLVAGAAGLASVNPIQKLLENSSDKESFKSALILVPATLIYGAITKKFMNEAGKSYTELIKKPANQSGIMASTLVNGQTK